jgi:hypothetical protein
MVIADHARDGDLVWCGYATLRDYTGLGRSTVIRGVKKLVTGGYLAVIEEGRPSRAARYRITVPPVSSQTTPIASVDIGSAPPDHRGVVTQTRGVSSVDTDLILTESITQAAREEEPTMDHNPDALGDAAAVWSETHPGREVEALAAALALERRRGVDASHPAGYFATWSRERRAAVKLAQSAEMAHSKQWCGKCDGATTRRVEDERGNLLYAPNGTVRRCDCWSPRQAIA